VCVCVSEARLAHKQTHTHTHTHSGMRALECSTQRKASTHHGVFECKNNERFLITLAAISSTVSLVDVYVDSLPTPSMNCL
jgi:hypothetical protein